MLTGFGIEWVWIAGPVVTLEKRRGVSYTLQNLGKVAGTCGESRLYLLHFVYLDLYANGYYTALYSLLGFSVSVIT